MGPKREYVRSDKEEMERLDFEEQIVRRCLSHVRAEYSRLNAEWHVLLELFGKLSGQESQRHEEASKKGHEKLERLHKSLRESKKTRIRPMEVVEVDDVDTLRTMMQSQIGKLNMKKPSEVPDPSQIPGPSSSRPEGDLVHLIGEIGGDSEMINALAEMDERTMLIINSVNQNNQQRCQTVSAEEHEVPATDLETDEFDSTGDCFLDID